MVGRATEDWDLNELDKLGNLFYFGMKNLKSFFPDVYGFKFLKNLDKSDE